MENCSPRHQRLHHHTHPNKGLLRCTYAIHTVRQSQQMSCRVNLSDCAQFFSKRGLQTFEFNLNVPLFLTSTRHQKGCKQQPSQRVGTPCMRNRPTLCSPSSPLTRRPVKILLNLMRRNTSSQGIFGLLHTMIWVFFSPQIFGDN